MQLSSQAIQIGDNFNQDGLIFILKIEEASRDCKKKCSDGKRSTLMEKAWQWRWESLLISPNSDEKPRKPLLGGRLENSGRVIFISRVRICYARVTFPLRHVLHPLRDQAIKLERQVRLIYCTRRRKIDRPGRLAPITAKLKVRF